MICKKLFWYEVWITVFPITNPPRGEVMGFLGYHYEYSELEVEDLFGHSASPDHNDPPNRPNLSTITALHLSLSECSDPDFVDFVGHWV